MRAGIDTLEIAKRLRNAGFSEPQAEAVTGVVRDARDADLSELATKADLAPIKADLAQLEARLRAELSQLESRLRTEIAALRSEMEILRRDLTIRLGSMIVVATGILLAAKFFG
jgi:hypothetical protein